MKKVFTALTSASEIDRYDAVCDLELLLSQEPETELPTKALEALEAMTFDHEEWDELSYCAGNVWASIIGADAVVEVARARHAGATGAARTYAARVLCEYATRDHLPTLIELSRDEDAQVALHALGARVMIEGANTRADIWARYEDTAGEERGALHDLVLMVTDGVDRLEQITAQLDDAEEAVRISALRGLRAEAWRPDARQLVPRALELALDPFSEHEEMAAHEALRSLGDPSVCDELFPLADFDDEEEACAITCTRLGDPRVVPKILEILEDEWNDEFVRTSWLWEIAELVALGRLEPALEDRVVDVALAMAADSEPYVLEFVAPYIAIMRPRDPVVVEALERLSHEDFGEEVRDAALYALALDMEPSLVRELMWTLLQTDPDEDPVATEVASMFAMEHGDERWVPGLLELVGEPERWAPAEKGKKSQTIDATPQAALMALARIGTPDAAARVREVIDARVDAPSLSMLQALFFLQDPRDLQRWKAMEKALGRKKGPERTLTLRGLAMCGDEKAHSALVKMLDTEKGPYSNLSNAAFALAALGDRIAIDGLVETACLFQHHAAEEALLWLEHFARSDRRAKQIIEWRLRGDELSKRLAARRARRTPREAACSSFALQDLEALA